MVFMMTRAIGQKEQSFLGICPVPALPFRFLPLFDFLSSPLISARLPCASCQDSPIIPPSTSSHLLSVLPIFLLLPFNLLLSSLQQCDRFPFLLALPL